MSRNVNDIISKLGPAQRRKVEARAAQLIAEEMTLQELRRARKMTQQKIAKSLNIGQEGVSKIERRSDLLISTLRRTVEAMGGRLSLVAEFPDGPPVILCGMAKKEPTKPARGSTQRTHRQSQSGSGAPQLSDWLSSPLLRFGNKLATRHTLQQIRSRSLLSANRAAELGHNESRFHGFAEGPPRRVAPLSRQSHVGAFDFQNVAWDLNVHALPRQ